MRLISLQYTQKMCQRYKQSSGLYLQAPLYIYKSLTSPIFEGTYNMLVSIHLNEFQKMSEARRTESAARFRQLQNRRMIIFQQVLKANSR